MSYTREHKNYLKNRKWWLVNKIAPHVKVQTYLGVSQPYVGELVTSEFKIIKLPFYLKKDYQDFLNVNESWLVKLVDDELAKVFHPPIYHYSYSPAEWALLMEKQND